jgi:hypothetical protein
MDQQAGKYFFNNYAVLSVIGSGIFSAFIYQKYGLQCFIFFLFQAAGAVLYL